MQSNDYLFINNATNRHKLYNNGKTDNKKADIYYNACPILYYKYSYNSKKLFKNKVYFKFIFIKILTYITQVASLNIKHDLFFRF